LLVQLADLEHIGLSSKQVIFVSSVKACISGESYIPLIIPLAFLFVLLVDPRHPKEDGCHWDLQMMT
jgi:hypothetical protein